MSDAISVRKRSMPWLRPSCCRAFWTRPREPMDQAKSGPTNSPRAKFRLTIAYDGTGYEGWQVQKIGTGVQAKLEEALAKLFPSQPQVHGSSRTDTGVHALGMVAH